MARAEAVALYAADRLPPMVSEKYDDEGHTPDTDLAKSSSTPPPSVPARCINCDCETCRGSFLRLCLTSCLRANRCSLLSTVTDGVLTSFPDAIVEFIVDIRVLAFLLLLLLSGRFLGDGLDGREVCPRFAIQLITAAPGGGGGGGTSDNSGGGTALRGLVDGDVGTVGMEECVALAVVVPLLSLLFSSKTDPRRNPLIRCSFTSWTSSPPRLLFLWLD